MGATVEFIVPPALLKFIEFIRINNNVEMQLNLSMFGINRTFSVYQMDSYIEPVNDMPPQHVNCFYATESVLSQNSSGLVQSLLELGIPSASDTIDGDKLDGYFRSALQEVTCAASETYLVVTTQQGFLEKETGKEVVGNFKVNLLDGRWL